MNTPDYNINWGRVLILSLRESIKRTPGDRILDKFSLQCTHSSHVRKLIFCGAVIAVGISWALWVNQSWIS